MTEYTEYERQGCESASYALKITYERSDHHFLSIVRQNVMRAQKRTKARCTKNVEKRVVSYLNQS